MTISTESAAQIARYLLEIKAVKLSPDKPFTWTSGWNSPIYCDNRVTLSHHEIRTYIKVQLAAEIKKRFPDVEAIAGVATAGIAQGALVADILQLPYAYVRPEPKKHGMKNQIEGQLPAGCKVVLIEDLISTGGSSLKAVQAMREENYHVLGLGAIFTYGFELADKQFKEAHCEYFTLSDYNALLEMALKLNYIDPSAINDLNAWRKDPGGWRK
jgi:orotate phosphoribosyltransferase